MLRKNKLGLVLLIYLILPTVIQKSGLRHIHHYQYWYSFSVNQTIQAACQNADWKDPKSSTIRTMVGYTLMWDGFMWLIFGYRHLRTQAIPYLKQKKYSKQNQFNDTRNMGWILLEQCSHSVTLKGSIWFVTDWYPYPGIYWVAPKGIQCCMVQIFGQAFHLSDVPLHLGFCSGHRQESAPQ